MQDFRYKAIESSSGQLLEGVLQAPTAEGAIDQLHAQGHIPVNVTASDHRGLAGLLKRDVLGKSRISGADLSSLSRELSTLLNARVSLERSLVILSSSSLSAPLNHLVTALLNSIREGKSLAEACESYGRRLPNLFIDMIRAGEKAGALNSVFDNLATYYETRQKNLEQVKSSLIYPIILLITAGLSIVFLISFVLPQFQPLFESSGKELPAITRGLLFFGDVMAGYWWLILIGLVAAIFTLQHLYAKPHYRQRMDRLVQRIPIVGALIKDNETAQLAGTVAMLVNNGTALNQALSVALSTTRNAVTLSWLETAEREVREGKSLSKAMESKGFPKMACQLIAIGEETGQLGAMLDHIAQIHTRNVVTNTQRLLTILSPALTILLGGVVAVIVGSLLATVMKINEFAF